MSRYVILATVDPSKLELFAQLRADHYGYLVKHRTAIVFGGPARIAEGGQPETMIIVIEVPTITDAEAFICEEPYTKQGGFNEVKIRPWSQVLPDINPGDLELTYQKLMNKET